MTEPKTYVRMRGILNGLFRVLFRPTIIGNENIPLDGRVVIAGNHTHFMDCISVAASTKRCVHFLAKSELMKPPLKWFFAPFGIIPVHRGQKDKAALSSAIEVLEDDKVIGIFPEGKVNEARGTLLPFKFGAVRMAQVTGSKVVPFVITGRYKFLRKSIKIQFFEPVTITDNLEESNQMLWNIVHDALENEKTNNESK
ncbi:MAG: 1-acyl-sn-glycerol-3-phosphate acyltransferase [Ruminococcaceae bacterium]|nr:1-acyl-sn-glycerol-3-phosphate acyltransferase [Oscillospiraceae bacterium]